MTGTTDLIARLTELRERARTTARIMRDTAATNHRESPQADVITEMVGCADALAARLAEVEGELDFANQQKADYLADYLRVHNEKMDHLEARLASESLNTTLASRLKEAEALLLDAYHHLPACALKAQIRRTIGQAPKSSQPTIDVEEYVATLKEPKT